MNPATRALDLGGMDQPSLVTLDLGDQQLGVVDVGTETVGSLLSDEQVCLRQSSVDPLDVEAEAPEPVEDLVGIRELQRYALHDGRGQASSIERRRRTRRAVGAGR